MKTRRTRVIAVFLAVLMLGGVFSLPTSAKTTSSSASKDSAWQEILDSLTAETYADYLTGAKNDGANKGTGEIAIDIFDYTAVIILVI